MMDTSDNDHLKQLDELLAANRISWLFGAGISFNSGIPLMNALTLRVRTLATEHSDQRIAKIIDTISSTMKDNYHIEHILSQIGDYIAIASRSKNRNILIGKTEITVNDLEDIHALILKWIADTIRWGYRQAIGDSQEQVGKQGTPIVTIDEHMEFVDALFHRNHAGIEERRRAVRFFTTNYDTLLEDALSLCCLSYWDGFAGGAVAYRNYRYGDNEPDLQYNAHVIKLHGSIDWHLGSDDRIWRVRDSDLYPDKASRVLIYPQSTKYLATQRDPFAAQFDLFRQTIGSNEENVLVTCGYSFGDEHINQEMLISLRHPENKTTIIAFISNLNEILKEWQSSPWSNRMYIATEDGLYVGDKGPFAVPGGTKKLNWWTFEGVTNILKSGAEACIK